MSLRRRHGMGSLAINLTPLIDLSLMLAVFFILCLCTTAAGVRALPVSLPQSKSGDPARDDPGTLEVAVDAHGAVSVDGRRVDLAALPALVRSGQRVALLADKDARHGEVVAVVDALRRAGATDIYYATQPALQDW